MYKFDIGTNMNNMQSEQTHRLQRMFKTKRVRNCRQSFLLLWQLVL